MSIVYDNTAAGQLILRGPAAGLVELSFPDMTGVTNKMVTLGADGKTYVVAKLSGDALFNEHERLKGLCSDIYINHKYLMKIR
jgi:hypothetical protein